jgi:DnaK suppressor protein
MALTEPELATLARQLDERRGMLIGEVHDELDDTEGREYGKLTGALPGDTGDQSIANAEADLNFAMTDRHVEEVQAIDAAKARMRDGTYGYCVDCGTEIGYERLLAYPTAERCIQDQERVEKTYVHENTPTL